MDFKLYRLEQMKCVRQYYFLSNSEDENPHLDVHLVQAVETYGRDANNRRILPSFDLGVNLSYVYLGAPPNYLFHSAYGTGVEGEPAMPHTYMDYHLGDKFNPLDKDIAFALFTEGLQDAIEWLHDNCSERFWLEPDFSWTVLQDALNRDLRATIGWAMPELPQKV